MSLVKQILTAAALTALSAPAFAGGLAPAAPAPVVQAPVIVPVAVAPSADWSGFYAGAQLGYGDFTADSADATDDSLTGTTYGAFAGYMVDFGALVAGAEIGYADASDIGSDLFDVQGDSMLTLKGRLGYDAGRFLPYVTVGGAQLTTTGAVADSDTGYLYGIGAEYALTDAWRIGAEASQYQFDDFADSGIDITGTLIGLRVSFSF